MTTPRPTGPLPTAHERAVTVHGALPLEAAQPSAQARSRALGQDEHNVMLALGLVRAARQALYLLEPKVQRACELTLAGCSQRAPAHAAEQSVLLDELTRSLREAVFDGYRLLEGGSVMFSVDDVGHTGEPLRVELPDMAPALLGERGLCSGARVASTRAEAELAVQCARASLQAGKLGLERAGEQLAVLLQHFHRQRGQLEPSSDQQRLQRMAEGLRRRLARAGRSALAAQGELSARTYSLL